ncbi:type I pullulanase [Paenibacillus polymyxa]|uniref:pullulanase n=1 Tax=Paenibacillus polymyxa (strain SC2) TaxID=886882 RepID=E3E6C0_PAEPS|nr:type I pullulanase [Paenibacillus polymyxa]ADO57989.1 alpha-dextrin endo-1,6-alpha-glucosidase [Paenibacillus polymyxa SC2]WPQ55690.1 type I pullulanase [Paenibacillus polymyxa]CCI70593.1 pullulanase [Paenibacillus polymyxa M1]
MSDFNQLKGLEHTAYPIYEGYDLGLTYTPAGSKFKVWAPTAQQVHIALYSDAGVYDQEGIVQEHGGGQEFLMSRDDQGVWSIELEGDWNRYYYMYRLEWVDHTIHYAADPYARAVSANGQRTAIIDLDQTNPDGWEQDEGPVLERATDAIIYELHVRDFSMDPHFNTGIKDLSAAQGRFAAFTYTGLTDSEGNRIGLDHLLELGITHVHLLPVADFHTVNDFSELGTEYNWGYDPQHYNVPEGSYSSNPADPEARIRELKLLVQSLHAAGIGVIMDVVYNHTYSVEKGPFEPVVPGYYYRTDEQGKLTNGSGVGNEMATERPMVRKYIKDSLRYWAEEYHIDGFRFDLMALIDTPTVEQLTRELRSEIRPDLLIYGEPWTGGESPQPLLTLKGTQRDKGFAVFNDNYRSAIKGDSDGTGSGFATGAENQEERVLQGAFGAIYDFTAQPSETVNYVTAHDNLNLWDKILTVRHALENCRFPQWEQGNPKDGRTAEQAVAEADPYQEMDESNLLENETVRKSLLANGMVLTSQGIPFIHAGDELLRSKYGDHNSYRSSDVVNAIRWNNKARFRPVFDYYQGLIALRRSHPAFRMDQRELVEQHMEVLQSSGHVVAFALRHHANGDAWNHIVVIYNGSDTEQTILLPAESDRWHVVVDAHGAGNETRYEVVGHRVTVSRWSMMVLYDQDGPPQASFLTEHDHQANEQVDNKTKGLDEGTNQEIAGTAMTDAQLGNDREVIPFRTIELIYERADRQYSGWNVWVWGTGYRDGHVEFQDLDDGRAVARIRVAPDVQRIGYIVRLNHWDAKDVEADRYIVVDLTRSVMQVLIHSGREEYLLLVNDNRAG